MHAEGLRVPFAAGVRRWWVPPATTTNHSPYERFTSMTSVRYAPQWAVTDRPGSIRSRTPG
ncbi:hypothetical protein NKG94_31585 [Micromonospora sp. M12]